MAEEIGITSLAFIAVSAFAFAWMVRLGFQVRRHVRDHSSHLHDRIDELEEASVKISKDIDTLHKELEDKVDDTYVDRKVKGLIELVHNK